jgi:hypothetical protein
VTLNSYTHTGILQLGRFLTRINAGDSFKCKRGVDNKRHTNAHRPFTSFSPNGTSIPLFAIAKILSKYAAVCALLLFFPMQRSFEIASIAPSAAPISTRASRTKKFSLGAGFGQEGRAVSWKQPCVLGKRRQCSRFLEQFWVQVHPSERIADISKQFDASFVY